MNVSLITKNAAPKRMSLRAKVVVLLAVIFGIGLVVVNRNNFANDPTFNRKKLSEWLADVDYGQPESKRKAARDAIAQMGTNALPLIMHYLRSPGPSWGDRFNSILVKVPFVKLKFATADDRLRRAVWGIDALGPVAAPVIPELLAMLQSKPGYVPDALASIGADAVPALQECLTNRSKFYIAGNTIGAINNALNRGRLPASSAAVFLPEVERWAASTNTHAQWYATNFVQQFAQANTSQVIFFQPNGKP